MGKPDYTDVILEDIDHKLDLIIELVQHINDTKANQSDIEVMHRDFQVVRFGFTQTNTQVHDHEKRITSLEAGVI